MSIRARIAKQYLLRNKRKLTARYANKPFNPILLRKWANRVTAGFKPPAKVKFEPFTLHDCYAEWVIPTEIRTKQVLLYVHGGAHVGGSAKTYRGITGKLAEEIQVKTLAIDYKLVPEHCYPAGRNDVINAFNWLVEIGYLPNEIILAGDSAGGGIVLSTALELRDQQKIQPGGIVLLSPWTDLTASNSSVTEMEDHDPILLGGHMTTIGKLYAGDLPADDPGISPIYAISKGLCPILVHVGSEEILLDDSVLLAERYKKHGTDIRLKVWRGCFHVFQIAWKYLPEGRKAIKEIGQFIKGLQLQ